MNTVIQNKRQAGREGTARLYEATRNRLVKFCHHKPFSLKRVTPQMVRSFEEYLRSCDLGINSVTNYMSIFRAVYNKASSTLAVTPKENPFQDLRLRPISTHKRSLPMEVIMDIVRLNLQGDASLTYTRDLFMFSFMACGMSFIDLAHLTHNNIINGMIIYRRAKTKTEIRVEISPGMRLIINKYKTANSPYLFPILKKNSTYAQYKVTLRTYNRRLERISEMLPYEIKLTSYVARHSWAMQAKENNISVTVIGEALGHTSEKTTRFYLKNLDQSILDKANRKIISALDKWIIKSSWKE